MAADFKTSEQMFGALRLLVDAWCDRRALRALSRILPGYLGWLALPLPPRWRLSDYWYGLRDAIQDTRVFAQGEILREEDEILRAAIAAIDQGVDCS